MEHCFDFHPFASTLFWFYHLAGECSVYWWICSDTFFLLWIFLSFWILRNHGLQVQTFSVCDYQNIKAISTIITFYGCLIIHTPINHVTAWSQPMKLGHIHETCIWYGTDEHSVHKNTLTEQIKTLHIQWAHMQMCTHISNNMMI